MKKTLLALGLIAATASFVGCNQKELEQSKVTIDSLYGVINAKDGEIDGLFSMLNEIEDNLSAINSKYSNVQQLRRNSTEGNYDRKKEISEQMSSIESMMAANKEKIAQLNSRIGSLGKKNTDLQAYITRLEERSAEQEKQISELLTELENNKVVIKGLNKNVTELTASNQEKDEYIAQQLAAANRAWFVVGSYNELKEAGVVAKTGGFIGIGRKKPQLVTQHPENSYELVADEEDNAITAYLRILDPTQFWKYTDYLVISTK